MIIRVNDTSDSEVILADLIVGQGSSNSMFSLPALWIVSSPTSSQFVQRSFGFQPAEPVLGVGRAQSAWQDTQNFDDMIHLYSCR